MPKSFPENFFLTTTKGKKLKLEYPCSVPLPSAVRLRSKEHRLQLSAQSEGVGSSEGAKVFTAVLLPRILRLARPVTAFFLRRGLELPRAPEVHQRAVPRGERGRRNLEGPREGQSQNADASDMLVRCIAGVRIPQCDESSAAARQRTEKPSMKTLLDSWPSRKTRFATRTRSFSSLTVRHRLRLDRFSQSHFVCA